MLFLIYTIDLHNRSTQAPRTNLKIVAVARAHKQAPDLSRRRRPINQPLRISPQQPTSMTILLYWESKPCELLPQSKQSATDETRGENRRFDEFDHECGDIIDAMKVQMKYNNASRSTSGVLFGQAIGALVRRHERGRLVNRLVVPTMPMTARKKIPIARRTGCNCCCRAGD